MYTYCSTNILFYIFIADGLNENGFDHHCFIDWQSVMLYNIYDNQYIMDHCNQNLQTAWYWKKLNTDQTEFW